VSGHEVGAERSRSDASENHPVRQEQMQTRFTLLSETVVIAIKAYSATCSILDNII